MRRKDRELLFVGIANSVIALDAKDGSEVWRQKLGGMTFVNVYFDGTQLFASAKGEVFCLSPIDGAIVWHNKLKGLGQGLVTFATSRTANAGNQAASSNQALRNQAAAAAAT